jgi:hypothetical protein
MSLIWRLTRELTPKFASDTHWTATSGQTIVGSVRRQVFGVGGATGKFEWIMHVDGDRTERGLCDTIEECKAKLEAAWCKQVKRYGLRDDPEAEPFRPKGGA